MCVRVCVYVCVRVRAGMCACVHVCACVRASVHVCACMCVCKLLPSNQSFDKQISSHQKGGGVSRWGECVGKATAYKFDTCTLIGVHSTMHLVDPIKVHVLYPIRIILCVCVYVCFHACMHVCTCMPNARIYT